MSAGGSEPSEAPALPQMISARQLCDRLAISRSTLHRLQRDGGFPQSIRLSERRVVWIAADVAAWIDERRRTASSTAAK